MDKGKLNDIICQSSSDYKILNDAYDYIENLEQQCKKQQEVIDKAINFLKKWGEEPDADMYMQMKEYKEFNKLLDILKEVSE